jgi:hypothetical protein
MAPAHYERSGEFPSAALVDFTLAAIYETPERLEPILPGELSCARLRMLRFKRFGQQQNAMPN